MNSIIFDIDGTICPIKKQNEEYIDLIPNDKMVKKIRDLKSGGYKIILFTSRNMRTYNNDIDLILKNTKPIIEKWLDKWNIPYDELIIGKPWTGPNGYYVDDRSIRPKELLNMTIEELDKIVEEDRI